MRRLNINGVEIKKPVLKWAIIAVCYIAIALVMIFVTIVMIVLRIIVTAMSIPFWLLYKFLGYDFFEDKQHTKFELLQKPGHSAWCDRCDGITTHTYEDGCIRCQTK